MIVLRLKRFMGDFYYKFPKDEILELIASGCMEREALEQINLGKKEKDKISMVAYNAVRVKDAEFRDAVDRAKKERADKWFEDIAKSVHKDLDKEQVAAEKLKFEQRKYLAAIDNPDKYAEKSKKEIDLNINIFQEMKDLPAAEAKKLLASVDPFNQIVEAEFQNLSKPETKVAQNAQNPENEEEDIFS